MRNSRFQQQNTAVHEAIRQNEYYVRHKQALQKIKDSVSKVPIFDTAPAMTKMAVEKQRTRVFEQSEKIQGVEKDNVRMLGKFIEIQTGKHLGVPRYKS